MAHVVGKVDIWVIGPYNIELPAQKSPCDLHYGYGILLWMNVWWRIIIIYIMIIF